MNKRLLNEAYHAENLEHEQGVWDAVKKHPKACFWAFIMCFTIVSSTGQFVRTSANAHQVMESFDMFLNGNFVAQIAFKNRYGIYVEGSGYTIPTKWQGTLFQSGQCGAFIGVFAAGPITNRLGYR